MITELNVRLALSRLGIKEGDSVITHSSFKSLGPVENGAQTIINGMRSAVGEAGTLVFSTLCSRDWAHVYENWHLDAESDVGYLTNYFRKLPGAIRSNHATHSVAAIGPMAEYITETHGESGLRYGFLGDTPFASDSPWDKTYALNTKILLMGVGIRKATHRHLAEYIFMEKYMDIIKASPRYEELKGAVWTYMKRGVWPHVDPIFALGRLEAEGKVGRTKLGHAELVAVSSVDFVDKIMELLNEFNPGIFYVSEETGSVDTLMDWFAEVENLQGISLG